MTWGNRLLGLEPASSWSWGSSAPLTSASALNRKCGAQTFTSTPSTKPFFFFLCSSRKERSVTPVGYKYLPHPSLLQWDTPSPPSPSWEINHLTPAFVSVTSDAHTGGVCTCVGSAGGRDRSVLKDLDGSLCSALCLPAEEHVSLDQHRPKLNQAFNIFWFYLLKVLYLVQTMEILWNSDVLFFTIFDVSKTLKIILKIEKSFNLWMLYRF